MPAPPHRRVQLRIHGLVQGVGFRPYVYRLATGLGLAGVVRNDEHGVTIEVEGARDLVADFLTRMPAGVPPAARLDHVTTVESALTGETTFRIAESRDGAAPDALVAPDLATCDACLRELHDPADRRYRYPFINCTDCGPRFTIVTAIPYDRRRTTMAGFRMCPACQAEFADPANRRFHAQPNACPRCGPRARLVDGDDRSPPGGAPPDPIAAAADALRDGAIVAIKGLGGYHLACRADRDDVVRTLRGRKHREDKPFALMVRNLAAAETLVELHALEREIMAGPARPIVLARRRAAIPIAAAVAPGHRDLGLMLPYTPLHHLLLGDLGGLTIVLTSGNVSDEPIVWRDEEARARLAPIADLFLVHDRPIATRTDDSVVRAVRLGDTRRILMLRRSRGFVPMPVALPGAPALLATGAELKNTFCVTRGGRAWPSHHIGDLENLETLEAFEHGIGHFCALFSVSPDRVACDLHPGYLSTRYALDRAGHPTVGVQHHHAHLAACLAEHGHPGPVVGAIYDGTGYGPDGTVWGGEVLVGDLATYERVGHLTPVRLPGGAAAIREPWRMACAWLVAAFGEDAAMPAALAGHVPEADWQAVARLAHRGSHAPLTTSMGRLFDAVSALAGLQPYATYEGQAALALEMIADPASTDPYPLPIVSHDEVLRLHAVPLVVAVLNDLRNGAPVPRVAGRFHAAVAAATVTVCARIAADRGLDTVALSGGVFQNVLLLERTAAGLAERGLTVLVPSLLPPNDGGIAYGQAAVAAATGLRPA